MDPQHQPCLNDEQLEMVADGECADQHLLNHIDQCDLCKKSLEEIEGNNQFLANFAQANPLLNDSPTPPVHHDDAPLPEILPGGYKVEHEIHRGGHGVVYRATQVQTNRPVAVKMLLLGALATPRQRMRFEREAEIVAALRHPGIVAIYDAGYLDDGRFGFAMEYVDGVTLDQWAKEHQVETQCDIRTRLKLFLKICDAVNFAHQQGIVHRDLKPANILIDKDNEPHILDFGIAKVLEEDPNASTQFGQSIHFQSRNSDNIQHTMPGEFSGTLAYASPEQVSGDPNLIDLRTDIYSLGIILYELLCSRLPYSVSGSITDVIHRIETEKPNAITQHIPILARDLSEIVSHTLQKTKLDRYQSVQDLSQDIQCYLDGRPIDIRRGSAWYVVGKTIRRKWIAATVLSASLFALTIFSIAMTLLYFQKDNAETNAILQLRARNISHAHTEWLIGDASLALDLLWNAQLVETKGLDEPQELLFANAIEPIDSYWEIWSFYARNPCLKTTAIKHGLGQTVAMSEDNQTIASFLNSQIHFYSAEDHRLLRTVDVDLPDWFTINHLKGGIGLIDNDQAVVLVGVNGITLFDAHTGQLISSHHVPNSPRYTIRLVLNNDTIAYSETGRQLVVINPLQDYLELHLDTQTGDFITTVIDSTDTLLATTTHIIQNHNVTNSIISIWNMPEGTLVARRNLPETIISSLFTPDSNSILLNSRFAQQKLWNFNDAGSPIQTVPIPIGTSSITWLNAGEQTINIQAGGKISIWDIKSKNKIAHYSGTSDNTRYAVPNPSKSTFITVGDKTIKTWHLPSHLKLQNTFPQANDYPHHDIAMSPIGQRIAWARNQPDNYQLHISNPTDESKPIVIDKPDDLITSIAFNHCDDQIAWALANGQVTLWDIESNTQISTFDDHDSGVRTIAMSPTQNILATGGEDAQIILRDLDSGQTMTLLGHSMRIPKIIFSPNGHILASCSMDGTVRLWDVQTGDLLKVIDLEQGIYALSFSPDNVHIAAGGRGQNITIINTYTDQHTTLQGDSSPILSLAYGPQGRVLVSGDLAGNISLWDTQSTKRLTKLPKHEHMVMSIKVSNDGQTMISCSAGQDPELRVWNLTAFNQHIAGNLEYHASIIEKKINKKPANLGAMQRWAAKIHGTQQ